MPVVDEIAEISPICSTIVAREIGTIVIIDVINNELSNPFPKIENTVESFTIGTPTYAASLTPEKSTLPVTAATT